MDREARARKVARLWASGLSIREVARRVGIHHQTAIADLGRWDPSAYGLDTYRERRQRRRVPARDKRMAASVTLHAAGKSLRQIAAELGVSYQTVSNDLARWERERPANVVPMLRKTGAQSCPGGGEITQTDYADVVSLSRKVSKSGVTNMPPGG